MRTTVLSYLDDFIARGDEIAFAHRRGLRIAPWSYEQIAQTAFQFARELEARAVGKGDRVLLWAENSPEWVASFLGCALRGAIVVPLDIQSDAHFVASVQHQVGAKLLVCSAETRSGAASVFNSISSSRRSLKPTRRASLPALRLRGFQFWATCPFLEGSSGRNQYGPALAARQSKPS